MSEERPPSVPDLDELEARFQRAFATGKASDLEVIGYGEISSVVAWPGNPTMAACKRLPDFPDRPAFETYRSAFWDYLERLDGAGVQALPTDLLDFAGQNGRWVAYAVQPLIEAESRGERLLERSNEQDGLRLIERIVDATIAVLSDPLLGFDAQLSNWVVVDDRLAYLDVTTPFIRDIATGVQRLDTRFFVASLPWLLRFPVQRWLAPSIVAEYYDVRITSLNFLANLHKEGAARWIRPALPLANRHLDEPITEQEVAHYYRRDARMWAFLQRLRRIDKMWQLRIRRRPYPVLLPGPIRR